MTSSTDMESKFGLIIVGTKATMTWGKRAEKESIHGEMGATMMGIGSTIK